MAKTGSNDQQNRPEGQQADEGATWSMDSMSDALRDAGRRASDLAQNPYARSLLAAGLVAAAAALASNKNVRDVTRKNLKAATDAVEVGADSAGKVGVAIVNAATDAVNRMLNLAGEAAGAAADTQSEGGKSASPPPPPPPPAARKSSAAKSSASGAAPKPRAAASAGGTKARTSGAKAGTAKAKAPGKSAGGTAAKKSTSTPRKRTPKADS